MLPMLLVLLQLKELLSPLGYSDTISAQLSFYIILYVDVNF